MARIYAIREDTGKRVLVEMQCDGSNCKETIKPYPGIKESGWMNEGLIIGTETFMWEYCPSCFSRIHCRH